MSAIAEGLRRQRVSLLGFTIAMLVGAAAWAVISRTTAEHLTASDYPVAAPDVEQAAWEVDYSSTGGFGQVSKQAKARYSTEKMRVGDAVTDIYDGIFLTPATLPEVIKRSFTIDAARSIDVKKLGFPAGASDVTTTTRAVEIALDATTARFAVSEVTIVAEASVENRVVEIKHQSTLWLERMEGTWKVVAFEVEQGPRK